MDVRKLEETARELVAPGKGILAADESFGTIGKRFEALGIESSEESRRAYREMLFTTEGIGEFLSGVILFDETIHQEASDGTPMPRGARERRRHTGHQGGQEHRGYAPLRGREVYPGTRRSGRQAGRVQEDRGALHQVAGRHHHRGRYSDRALHRGQRGGARPLRRVRPGARPRPHSRARGPYRRRPFDRAVLRRHGVDAAPDLRRALRARRRALGDAPETEHGDLRQGRESRRPASRRWPARRSSAYSGTCRRPYPASSSSPAARRICRRRPTSTP